MNHVVLSVVLIVANENTIDPIKIVFVTAMLCRVFPSKWKLEYFIK